MTTQLQIIKMDSDYVSGLLSQYNALYRAALTSSSAERVQHYENLITPLVRCVGLANVGKQQRFGLTLNMPQLCALWQVSPEDFRNDKADIYVAAKNVEYRYSQHIRLVTINRVRQAVLTISPLDAVAMLPYATREATLYFGAIHDYSPMDTIKSDTVHNPAPTEQPKKGNESMNLEHNFLKPAIFNRDDAAEYHSRSTSHYRKALSEANESVIYQFEIIIDSLIRIVYCVNQMYGKSTGLLIDATSLGSYLHMTSAAVRANHHALFVAACNMEYAYRDLLNEMDFFYPGKDDRILSINPKGVLSHHYFYMGNPVPYFGLSSNQPLAATLRTVITKWQKWVEDGKAPKRTIKDLPPATEPTVLPEGPRPTHPEGQIVKGVRTIDPPTEVTPREKVGGKTKKPRVVNKPQEPVPPPTNEVSVPPSVQPRHVGGTIDNILSRSFAALAADVVAGQQSQDVDMSGGGFRTAPIRAFGEVEARMGVNFESRRHSEFGSGMLALPTYLTIDVLQRELQSYGADAWVCDVQVVTSPRFGIKFTMKGVTYCLSRKDRYTYTLEQLGQPHRQHYQMHQTTDMLRGVLADIHNASLAKLEDAEMILTTFERNAVANEVAPDLRRLTIDKASNTSPTSCTTFIKTVDRMVTPACEQEVKTQLVNDVAVSAFIDMFVDLMRMQPTSGQLFHSKSYWTLKGHEVVADWLLLENRLVMTTRSMCFTSLTVLQESGRRYELSMRFGKPLN